MNNAETLSPASITIRIGALGSFELPMNKTDGKNTRFLAEKGDARITVTIMKSGVMLASLRTKVAGQWHTVAKSTAWNMHDLGEILADTVAAKRAAL